MAWLSEITGSPSTRFVRDTVPYTLVDGAVVANHWTDLTAGNIAHQSERSEQGRVPDTNGIGCTNTKIDGTPDGLGPGGNGEPAHGQSWMSDYGSDSGNAGIAHPTILGAAWTHFDVKQHCLTSTVSIASSNGEQRGATTISRRSRTPCRHFPGASEVELVHGAESADMECG